MVATGSSDRPQFLNAGQNPRAGIIFHYYLVERPDDPVVLNIRSSAGDLIRSLSSQSSDDGKDAPLSIELGLNRSFWNLRYPGAVDVEDALTSWARSDGPLVVPGRYLAELVVDGENFTQSFEVQADPRIETRPEEFEQQRDMLLEILDRLSQNNELINKLVVLKGQVDAWTTRTHIPAVIAAAGSVSGECNDLLPALINLGIAESQLYSSGLHEKFNALFDSVDSADYAPPRQAREVMQQLSAELDQHIERVVTILAEKVRVFNIAITEAGLEAADPL
jgi:hypothetical protein